MLQATASRKRSLSFIASPFPTRVEYEAYCRGEIGLPASASLPDEGTYRAALRHACPFIKSCLHWHSNNIQPYPTWMMDFSWTGSDDDELGYPVGHPRAGHPLIYVVFPGRVRTAWMLCDDGCKLYDANPFGSSGNMFYDHINFGEYAPLVSTAALAKAARRMTLSFVDYDDREDPRAEHEVSDPSDPRQWEPTQCFSDIWEAPEADDDVGWGRCEQKWDDREGPGSYSGRQQEEESDDDDMDGERYLGPPHDLLIYRLFVDELGLAEGPAVLREVLRRTWTAAHEKAAEEAGRREGESGHSWSELVSLDASCEPWRWVL